MTAYPLDRSFLTIEDVLLPHEEQVNGISYGDVGRMAFQYVRSRNDSVSLTPEIGSDPRP